VGPARTINKGFSFSVIKVINKNSSTNFQSIQ